MGDDLYQITMVGLTAVFFIVAAKLIFSRYYVPGVSDVIAMV